MGKENRTRLLEKLKNIKNVSKAKVEQLKSVLLDIDFSPNYAIVGVAGNRPYNFDDFFSANGIQGQDKKLKEALEAPLEMSDKGGKGKRGIEVKEKQKLRKCCH